MGYANDLGTSTVAGIDPTTGYPQDADGNLLNPLSLHDGVPVKDWNKAGTELANLTNPYGFLEFAVGTGDDFTCFDYATIDAGPLGSFVILDATWNTETGGSIEGAGYQVMPANSIEERKAVAIAAYALIDQALDTLGYNDIRHTLKGWNQDPYYFARAVTLSLFPWIAPKNMTDRMKRHGSKRLDKIINDYLHGGK